MVFLPRFVLALALLAGIAQLASAKRLLDASSPARTANADWAMGWASWQQARQASAKDKANLWDELNVCDPPAVVGSAPLTVLFGISSFWENIKTQRDARKTDGPLEVHVIGAAYPFEGRSDWSLLASRRPADVPSVRIVLVLGTPWQDDNLPSLKESTLLQVGGNSGRGHIHPIGGHWSDANARVVCDDDSAMKLLDADFKRENICRDHGNGLEVVCVEKLYQEAHLPIPDVAVMFSPGFPQLARRSWDIVLRKMLDNNVLMMVSDEAFGPSLSSMFTKEHMKAEPTGIGHKLGSNVHPGESGMTFQAMAAYKARKLGAHRNPFPLMLLSDGEQLAKCAVLQVFQGREDGAGRQSSLPIMIDSDRQALNDFNWKQLHDDGYAKDVRNSLSTPVSPAYEEACRDMYLPRVQEMVDKKGWRSFTAKDRLYLKKLGLHSTIMKDSKDNAVSERWGPRAWLFFLEKLQAKEFT